MQVRKANRIVLAAAMAVVTTGLSSAALGQYNSGNNIYIVSNGSDRVEVYNGGGNSPGSHVFSVPLKPGGTQYGITFDHQNTSAFYVLEDNTIRTFWESGSGSPLYGPTWNIGYQGYDITYQNSELFVTRRDNTIQVYNAYTGAHKRNMTISSALALHGIDVDWRSGRTNEINTGDWNRGVGGQRVEQSNGNVNTQNWWGDNGGLNYLYNHYGYMWSPSRNDTSTQWWFNSSGNGNVTTGTQSSRLGGEGWDWAATNSTNRYMMSFPAANQVGWWDNGQWGQGRSGNVGVSDPRGLFWKYNGNGSTDVMRFSSFTGLNDIVISDDAEAGLPGSGQDLRSEAAASVYNPGSIISRMNSGATTVRTGNSESNAGSGSITLNVPIDYDGLSANQSLAINAGGHLTINGAISDSNPGTAVNLNLTLGSHSPLIAGTTSDGDMTIAAPINLTAGSFTASGTSFNNANGAITAGAFSLNFTGAAQINADLSVGSMSTNSGSLVVNSPVTSSGAVNMTSSGAITLASTMSGTNFVVSAPSINVVDALTASGTVNMSSSGSVNLASTVSGTDITLSSATLTVSSPLAASGNLSLTSSSEMTLDAEVSGQDVTINAGGLTTTAAITAAGALSLSNSGASSLGAPISAGSLSISSTLDLEGDLQVSGSLGTGGGVNILAGGMLTVDTLEADIPDLNLDGGTLTLTGTGSLVGGESVAFNSGMISIAGNRTLTGSNALNQRLLGTSASVGKSIEIGGTFTLSTGFTLNGGKLSVGGLNNGYNLTFTSGTLEYTGGSFSVSGSGPFGDTVVFGPGKIVSVTGSATASVGSEGYVSLSGGRLSVDTTLTNDGEIVLSSPTTRIQGDGTFTNNGLLQGTGRIEISDVINSSSGVIRAGSGQSMRFLTAVSNSGRIELQGGSFETTSLSNAAGSVLAMSNGSTLRLNAGAPSFNAGSVLISGNADFYGDMTNDTGGVVRIGGGGVVNFFDDIDNNATFEVAGGSAAVFFGTLDPGTIDGFGTVVIFGGLGPRIGQNGVEGDVTLGDAATTTMLIGTATEYSSLTIGGEGQLAGTLVVTETGYRHLGAVYELITADSLVGQFSNVILPAAGFGMNYELQYNGNSVFAVVVPEPATLSALAGLVALGLRRRR